MTRTFLCIFLLCSFVHISAQSAYGDIDNTYKTVPKELKSAAEIARYVTKDLQQEEEKVRAIYIWVTHNIQYDMEQISNPVTFSEQINIADEALKYRKGVCEHYAQLFHKMCTAIGITSYVIPGYTRQSESDKIDPLNHAWNGVVVNNTYLFVDATWDAGYFSKGGYVHEFQDDFFLVEPIEFIKTHVPFDPIWQFLNKPITHWEYKSRDFSKLGHKGNFAFKDSIATMAELDTITSIIKTNKRITAFGVTNDLIKEELTANDKLLEYYRYNAWVSLFNNINDELILAVEEINLAIAYHNAFFKMINKKQGSSNIADQEVKTNLDNASRHIAKGQEMLKIVESNLGALEYLGNDKDHLLNAKTNKKNILVYIAKLKESNVKLKASINKNWEFYRR